MEKGLADRLKEAPGGQQPDLMKHLTDLQIAARQIQAFLGVIDELVEVGSDDALDMVTRLAEVASGLARKLNHGLDTAALDKFEVK